MNSPDIVIRPKEKIPDECKTMLIGEGGNDARFLAVFARRVFGDDSAFGFGIGGRPKLGSQLDAVAGISDLGGRPAFLRLRALAVVLDANQTRSEAEGEINAAIAASGIELTGGGRIAHGEVRPAKFHGHEMLVGSFVMPGEGRDGYLEDLVLSAATESNPEIMECVDNFRARAREINGGPKKENEESKKQAQALLSALRNNCVYVGTAAEQAKRDEDKGETPDIDFSAPAYAELQEFILALKKGAP